MHQWLCVSSFCKGIIVVSLHKMWPKSWLRRINISRKSHVNNVRLLLWAAQGELSILLFVWNAAKTAQGHSARAKKIRVHVRKKQWSNKIAAAVGGRIRRRRCGRDNIRKWDEQKLENNVEWLSRQIYTRVYRIIDKMTQCSCGRL